MGILFISIFVVKAVIAYTAGNSNLSIVYNLVTNDIAGRHYTPNCLGTCDLVFSLSYTGTNAPASVMIDSSKLQTQFNWLKGHDKFKESRIYYLNEYQEQVTDYSTVCNPYNTTIELPNATYSYPYFKNCTQIVIGSHLETRKEWKELSTLTLQKDKTYYIDIRGYFNPSMDGGFKVDVIPKINIAGTNFELSEMALWGSEYPYKRKDSVNQTTPSTLYNFTYYINGSGGFNLGSGTTYALTVIKNLPSSSINGTQYLVYASNGSFGETNATNNEEMPVDVIEGPGTNFSQTSVYDSSTLLFLPFSEGAGTRANDRTANDNDGTATSINWDTKGKVGHGIKSQTSTITGNIAQLTTQITIEAWLNVTMSSTGADLANWIAEGTDGYNDWSFGVEQAGNVRYFRCFWTYAGATGNIVQDNPIVSDWNDGKWHHFACVKNSSHLTLFINGVQRSTKANTATLTTGTTYQIAASTMGSMDGVALDELFIYKEGKSDDWIRARYEMLKYNYSSLGAEEFYDTIAPNTTQPIITPSQPKSSDNLKCNATLTDNIATTLTAYWKWYRNNQLYLSGSTTGIQNGTNSLITTLLAGNTSKGENWICEVKPYDGYNYGNAINSTSVTILNTPPTHTNPKLQASSYLNTTSDNLTCYNQSTQDTDNDKVINIYNWFRNAQSLEALNLPFESNARDYSGNNNTATIFGGATFTTGKYGRALLFDGINDYVEVPQFDTTVNISKATTIEMWFNVKVLNKPNQALISKNVVNGHRITVNDTGTVYYVEGLTSGTYVLNTASGEVSPNNWYHVATTYNGSELRLYVNGILKDSKPATGDILNNRSLQIGRCIGGLCGADEYINGTIDEVRIYNISLSAEQIKAHFNQEYNKIVSQETTAGETYSCQITPNDAEDDGVTLSSNNVTILVNITFDVRDSYSNVSLDYVVISCNYSGFDQGGDTINPYGPYGFLPGIWECNLTKSGYYDKTVTFVANYDKILFFLMSEKGQISIEEHTWLEWLYNCWHNGDCWNLLTNINQTTTRIWQRITGTDRSVVVQEKVLSNNLTATSNISINYTINIPYKEGIPVGELLPIRLYFWFTDINRTRCYNQDKANINNRVESPYCLPLVAEILGPNNGSVSFVVDLRPALPSGIYNFTRSIEIDPIGVWTNYGREDLGNVNVLEDNSEVSINTNNLKTKFVEVKSFLTGSAIKNSLDELFTNNEWIFVLILAGMVCATIILYSYFKYVKRRC